MASFLLRCLQALQVLREVPLRLGWHRLSQMDLKASGAPRCWRPRLLLSGYPHAGDEKLPHSEDAGSKVRLDT